MSACVSSTFCLRLMPLTTWSTTRRIMKCRATRTSTATTRIATMRIGTPHIAQKASQSKSRGRARWRRRGVGFIADKSSTTARGPR